MSVFEKIKSYVEEAIAYEKGELSAVEYYLQLPYRIEIIPDNVEGNFIFQCPELPGCVTSADSIEEGYALLIEAKRSWFLSCLKSGANIPKPTPIVRKKYETLPDHIRRECDESTRRTVPDAHATFCKRAFAKDATERHIESREDAFLQAYENAYREGWSAGYVQLRHDLQARARETAIELRGIAINELLLEATGLTLQGFLAVYKEQ